MASIPQIIAFRKTISNNSQIVSTTDQEKDESDYF